MAINPKHPANSRAAVVTGASSGLGRELAKQFSADGFHVILSGRNKEELRRTQEACLQVREDQYNRGVTSTVVGDLCSSTVIRQLADVADLWNAEYLVSCAAVYSKDPVDKSVPIEILFPNLMATINLVRSMYPTFTRMRRGMFLNINSSAGKGFPEQESLYAASKHGLTGFFGSLRQEARRKNIRVMDVFLGGMKTPMMKHRSDFDYLIDPAKAAELIYRVAVTDEHSFQVDELTLSRFSFPANQAMPAVSLQSEHAEPSYPSCTGDRLG